MDSYVITGFLGVGKTTILLETIKNNFQDKNVAIVVNEFGEVGIDGKILKNVHSEVVEISEGCICCQLAQEFESGVIEIINKYNPDIIFVETSGASEPFPIFLSLQNLGININGVICVCDAKNFNSYKDNQTAKYQIGGSNIIVLSKTDLTTDDELKSVKEEIKSIKEEYDLKNTLTGEKIFNSYVITESKKGKVPNEIFKGSYDIEQLKDISNNLQHNNHTQDDNITQDVAYIKEDTEFMQIDTLLKNLPNNIYRVKGIVKTKDTPSYVLINYSFGYITYQEVADYNKDSLLVFIGQDIKDSIKEILDKNSFLFQPAFRIKK